MISRYKDSSKPDYGTDDLSNFARVLHEASHCSRLVIIMVFGFLSRSGKLLLVCLAVVNSGKLLDTTLLEKIPD